MLAFVNSYIPLFAAAFVDKDFITLYLTLAIVLIFKQIFMAILDNLTPLIKMPRKFKKLNSIIDKHIHKYNGEYEDEIEKNAHRSAEV
mmetsp:Transcript_94119/g.129593  ORF Transcript_94119/g.129593 Transcript_94119/m.129593 type:complete len:88 (+) Transcript_94119:2556-2819(+)